MARILLLEDETDIQEAVSEYLRLADHEVTAVANGDEAVRLLSAGSFDLHVLDVRVPGASGFEVAKKMRSHGATGALLFLTARDDEAAKITGFELGADDYLSKPFSPRELVLRVEAILRRYGTTTSADHPPERRRRLARQGGRELRFDGHKHDVRVDGVPVALTPTEWRLLDWFLTNPEQVISREKLLETVLGYREAVESRTADTHIKNLRGKLGSPDWIETVRGFGYRFGTGEIEGW